MSIKSITTLFAAVWLSLGGSPSLQPVQGKHEQGGTGFTVMMFGASWCAPCVAELRRLPELAAAASPGQLVIAWIDRQPGMRGRALPDNVRIMSPDEARRHFASISEGNQGLPLTAMFDTAGKRCGLLRKPADASGLRRLKEDCERSGLAPLRGS